VYIINLKGHSYDTATSQLITHSSRHTVNVLVSSRSQLVTSEHTTKPSAAEEVVFSSTKRQGRSQEFHLGGGIVKDRMYFFAVKISNFRDGLLCSILIKISTLHVHYLLFTI